MKLRGKTVANCLWTVPGVSGPSGHPVLLLVGEDYKARPGYLCGRQPGRGGSAILETLQQLKNVGWRDALVSIIGGKRSMEWMSQINYFYSTLIVD